MKPNIVVFEMHGGKKKSCIISPFGDGQYTLCGNDIVGHTCCISKKKDRIERDGMIAEIKRLGGTNIIISSNVPLKNDGLPYANWQKKSIQDNGVAVYFMYKGEQFVFCCDKWTEVKDNMQAICKAVEALRGLDRWGVSDFIKNAFSGFKAIEAPSENWWDVLQIYETANESLIKSAYKGLAKIHHPDMPNGDAATFQRIQRAYEEGLNQLKK